MAQEGSKYLKRVVNDEVRKLLKNFISQQKTSKNCSVGKIAFNKMQSTSPSGSMIDVSLVGDVNEYSLFCNESGIAYAPQMNKAVIGGKKKQIQISGLYQANGLLPPFSRFYWPLIYSSKVSSLFIPPIPQVNSTLNPSKSLYDVLNHTLTNEGLTRIDYGFSPDGSYFYVSVLAYGSLLTGSFNPVNNPFEIFYCIYKNLSYSPLNETSNGGSNRTGQDFNIGKYSELKSGSVVLDENYLSRFGFFDNIEGNYMSAGFNLESGPVYCISSDGVLSFSVDFSWYATTTRTGGMTRTVDCVQSNRVDTPCDESGSTVSSTWTVNCNVEDVGLISLINSYLNKQTLVFYNIENMETGFLGIPMCRSEYVSDEFTETICTGATLNCISMIDCAGIRTYTQCCTDSAATVRSLSTENYTGLEFAGADSSSTFTFSLGNTIFKTDSGFRVLRLISKSPSVFAGGDPGLYFIVFDIENDLSNFSTSTFFVSSVYNTYEITTLAKEKSVLKYKQLFDEKSLISLTNSDSKFFSFELKDNDGIDGELIKFTSDIRLYQIPQEFNSVTLDASNLVLNPPVKSKVLKFPTVPVKLDHGFRLDFDSFDGRTCSATFGWFTVNTLNISSPPNGFVASNRMIYK